MKVWVPLLPTSQLQAGKSVFLISSSCTNDITAGLELQRCSSAIEGQLLIPLSLHMIWSTVAPCHTPLAPQQHSFLLFVICPHSDWYSFIKFSLYLYIIKADPSSSAISCNFGLYVSLCWEDRRKYGLPGLVHTGKKGAEIPQGCLTWIKTPLDTLFRHSLRPSAWSHFSSFCSPIYRWGQ